MFNKSYINRFPETSWVFIVYFLQLINMFTNMLKKLINVVQIHTLMKKITVTSVICIFNYVIMNIFIAE